MEKKIGHPQIIRRIRSNSNFEVILKVKKAKKQNWKELLNRFWQFLAKILVTKSWNARVRGKTRPGQMRRICVSSKTFFQTLNFFKLPTYDTKTRTFELELSLNFECTSISIPEYIGGEGGGEDFKFRALPPGDSRVRLCPERIRDDFGQEFCESSRVRVHKMRVEPSRVWDCELWVESSCELSSRVVKYNR